MLRRTLPSFARPSLLCRHMSVVAKSLKYTQHGEPQDVLKLVEDKLSDPTDKQVLVQILAAPINPADINTIQGRSIWFKISIDTYIIYLLYKQISELQANIR